MKMGNIYNDNNGDDNDRQGTNLDQKSSHEPTVLVCKYGLSFKKITKEKGAHLHVRLHERTSTLQFIQMYIIAKQMEFLGKKCPRVHFAFYFVFRQSKMHYNVWKMYTSSFLL